MGQWSIEITAGIIEMIEDIKDKTPNPDLVRHCQKLLAFAESGQLRSAVYVLGWDDDSWTQSFVMDGRSSSLRMLGMLSALEHEMHINYALEDDESILSQAFNDD